MTDIKTWMEETNLRVADTCFKKPPQLPYIVFLENPSISGADDKDCISSREITVELYSGNIDYANEDILENLLYEKSTNFKKNRTWVDSESFFQTTYDFTLYEKF